MTLPIGYSTPPMTMHQILGVTPYNPATGAIPSNTNLQGAASAQSFTATSKSTDYTQLSASTLMAIGQNPNAGQSYPPQGSIFNNQVMPSGYPMPNTAGAPYPSSAYPTVGGSYPMPNTAGAPYPSSAYPTVGGSYPMPNTAGAPYPSSAYPTVGGGYPMPNTAGSLSPQQQAILTQIQNDPTTSPEQKQVIIQQLLGGSGSQQPPSSVPLPSPVATTLPNVPPTPTEAPAPAKPGFFSTLVGGVVEGLKNPEVLSTGAKILSSLFGKKPKDLPEEKDAGLRYAEGKLDKLAAEDDQKALDKYIQDLEKSFKVELVDGNYKVDRK
ncbi:MAG: hypothetical protein H2174_09475 [Vampirovibrio sp.]|nr:hypothetical protein [Vampirovibrio sp.]